jgi:hypothetical protein
MSSVEEDTLRAALVRLGSRHVFAEVLFETANHTSTLPARCKPSTPFIGAIDGFFLLQDSVVGQMWRQYKL